MTPKQLEDAAATISCVPIDVQRIYWLDCIDEARDAFSRWTAVSAVATGFGISIALGCLFACARAATLTSASIPVLAALACCGGSFLVWNRAQTRIEHAQVAMAFAYARLRKLPSGIEDNRGNR